MRTEGPYVHEVELSTSVAEKNLARKETVTYGRVSTNEKAYVKLTDKKEIKLLEEATKLKFTGNT